MPTDIGKPRQTPAAEGFEVGEAKRRRKLRDQVLADYPHCIFCGGKSPASTVDHFPPIAVFDLRQRPRGLEFPACQACNDGGRLDELVAAMLSRMLPDSDTEAAKDEVQRLMQAVHNNIPGLLEELTPSFRQKKLARRIQDRLPPGGGGAIPESW